jgi:serine/threonine-protein kinase RIM15
VASEVSVPALKDEEAKEPIERQRLLSPGSERKMSQIRNWSKPATEDAALSQLVQDAERVMRQKLDNVARMQNTIRYAEKIWHEWEERVGHALATVDESSGSDESESEDDEQAQDDEHEGDDDGDHSSTTSEYDYDGVATGGSSDPTPMAASPRPASFGSDARPTRSPHPASVPYPPRQKLHTRSSTPSSVSSPLALAAPIVAPSSPDDVMPPMSLDEAEIPLALPPQTLLIKTRKSSSSLLDPAAVPTPVSPLTARDAGLAREPSTKRGHRRLSTANHSIAVPPTSPRAPSTAPIPRTSPTSIKDFDIIKPISKGAFGSVFLAKKKVTGDYFAIKVLKKADMIAKNQITNVKAERMILMKQAESPFVAKLYFTFQSKENLYLVMEYLNGGDCAALIKSLGSLPEEWTKNYIAEVVLGLEYLHQRGVVHRCALAVSFLSR